MIRAHAAVGLIYLGENKRAQAFLSKLLKDKDVNKREIALDSLDMTSQSTSRSVRVRRFGAHMCAHPRNFKGSLRPGLRGRETGD